MQTNIAISNKLIKKRIIIKPYIVIIGFLASLILIFVSLLFIQNVQSRSLSQNMTKQEKVDNLFVKSYCESHDDVKNIIKQIYNFPTKVIDVLHLNNIKINYVSTNVNYITEYKNVFNYSATGIFDGDNKQIFLTYTHLDGDQLYYKNFLALNTFHEIGHAFDNDYTSTTKYVYSSSQEFNTIFKAEATNLFSKKAFSYLPNDYLNFHSSDKREYFAECFSLYFTDNILNETLKLYAPKTYEYIAKIVQLSYQSYKSF